MNLKYLILGVVALSFLKPQSLSKNGMKHLKMVEGVKNAVYIDSAGHPTVGVGHKILPEDNLSVGDVISNQRIDSFLRNDIKIASKAVRKYVNVPLNQNQFDALVSFVFNIGVDAFKVSTLREKLNQYDYFGALAEFPRWKFVTIDGIKVENRGLINRREAEQFLFNS